MTEASASAPQPTGFVELEDPLLLLETVVRHAPVLLLAATHGGVIRAVNHYTVDRLGWSPDDLAAADYEPLWPFPAMRRRFHEACRQGAPVECLELLCATRAGDTVPFRCRIVPISPETILCIGTDVTVLQRLEKRISDSETWFLELGNARNVGFWHYKIGDQWIYLDPLLRELAGEQFLVDERLPFDAWPSLVAQDEYHSILTYLKAQYRGGADRIEFRCCFPAAAGGPIWGHVRGTIFRDVTGRVQRVAGTVENVTELHRLAMPQCTSERKFQLLAESTRDLFYIAGLDGCMEYVSPAVEEIWGLPAEKLQRSPYAWLDRVHPEDREAVLQLHRGSGDYPRVHQFRVNGPNGVRWVRARLYPIREDSDEIAAHAGLVVDVTTEVAAAYRLNSLLTQKDLMLAELQHRVKNNLQIIASIISLQAARAASPEASLELQSVQARVRSIAIVHETMYAAERQSQVDFSTCAGLIADRLFDAFAASERGIRLLLRVNPVVLSAEHAVACGLLLNELMSNSLKHGFPDGRAGSIEIRLENLSDKVTLLEVADDGVGLPEEYDWDCGQTLGMSVIKALARQIHATLELSGRTGVRFTVTFENPWIETDSFVRVE